MSSSSSTAATTAAAAKAPRKTAKKAEAAPVAAAAPAVAAPVVATPAVAAPVVATPATAASPSTKVEETVNVMAEFDTLLETVNTMRNTLATVCSELKKLQKQTAREMKKASKGKRRRAATLTEGGEVKPKRESVFTKPTKITDELATFLGKSKGSEMVRGDVTKAIMNYVKERKLNNKQQINADGALKKLLRLSDKDELTILNLQRYLNPHYLKAVPTVTA